MDYRAGAVARLPGWALGVSLALHGVFLTAPAWHALRQARPPVPLLATLRPAAPAHLELPAVAAGVAAPPVSARSLPHSRARPARVLEPAPARPLHAANEPAALAARTSEPLRETMREAPPQSAPRAEAPPAAALAGYARLLADLLARRQPYPRLAAQRGWQGEVRLGVQVARKGAIVAVLVLQSSGFEVLDRHALQLVQEAAPLPRLPDELQEHEFHIVVPIHYKLEKTT